MIRRVVRAGLLFSALVIVLTIVAVVVSVALAARELHRQSTPVGCLGADDRYRCEPWMQETKR